MSRSNPRPDYVGDTPIYIDDQHTAVQYRKENPREHWPGRKYPEWALADEADNLPGSAEQAGFEQQFSNSNGDN